jgi:hypothetical protein
MVLRVIGSANTEDKAKPGMMGKQTHHRGECLVAGNSQPYAEDEAVLFLDGLRSGRSPKTAIARLPNRKKKHNALAVISSSLPPNPNTTGGGIPPDFLQKVLKNLHWLKQGNRNQTSDCDRGGERR